MNDTSPFAFPRALAAHEAGQDPVQGMSLRDFFAAKAMQGYLSNNRVINSNPTCGWSLVNCSEEDLAGMCYRMADQMLAERAKGRQP